MNAIKIDEKVSQFRARIKALKIKRWDKNVWAVESEAEKYIQELLTYVPDTQEFPAPTPPTIDI